MELIPHYIWYSPSLEGQHLCCRVQGAHLGNKSLKKHTKHRKRIEKKPEVDRLDTSWDDTGRQTHEMSTGCSQHSPETLPHGDGRRPGRERRLNGSGSNYIVHKRSLKLSRRAAAGAPQPLQLGIGETCSVVRGVGGLSLGTPPRHTCG